MRNIQVKSDKEELFYTVEMLRAHPINGEEVAVLMAKSILEDLSVKLQMRQISWSAQPLKKRTLTLKNHEARALTLFLARAIGSGKATDTHQKTCLDMFRWSLNQKLS